MSIRDFGVIELSVFAALFGLFVVFFGLFVMLRHRKRVANSRRLLKKRALMEEAIRQKVRPARGRVRQEVAMGTVAEESGMPRQDRRMAGQEAVTGTMLEESGMPRQDRRMAGQETVMGTMTEESRMPRQDSRMAGQEAAMGTMLEESGMPRQDRRMAGQEAATGTMLEESGMPRQDRRMAGQEAATGTMAEESGNAIPSRQKGMARKVVVKKKEEMRETAKRQAYVGFSGNRARLSEEYGEEITGSMGRGQQGTFQKEAAHLQREGADFVEHRRISHRRDQLKRMEEAK